MSTPSLFDTCFFERDPGWPLWRRTGVETAGTMLLMLAATGAGLSAQRLFTNEPSLGLIVSASVIAAALVSLIVAFGAVSGGHFNPLITGLQWLTGERSPRCTLFYVSGQCVGGIVGALIARGLFPDGVPASADSPATWVLALSEAVDAAALMTVVFSCARSGRKETGPFAVGVWLFAAIIATPSTSYANPAITVAALFARGPIGLSPFQALAYVPAEIVGALIALVPVTIAYPRRSARVRVAIEPRVEAE